MTHRYTRPLWKRLQSVTLESAVWGKTWVKWTGRAALSPTALRLLQQLNYDVFFTQKHCYLYLSPDISIFGISIPIGYFGPLNFYIIGRSVAQNSGLWYKLARWAHTTCFQYNLILSTELPLLTLGKLYSWRPKGLTLLIICALLKHSPQFMKLPPKPRWKNKSDNWFQ